MFLNQIKAKFKFRDIVNIVGNEEDHGIVTYYNIGADGDIDYGVTWPVGNVSYHPQIALYLVKAASNDSVES